MDKTVVLVTGANRGIGYAIVKALVAAPPTTSGSGSPYHVFLTSRTLEKGKAAAEALQPEHGTSVSVIELDVTSAESISKAVSTVEAEAGRLDILVNNAGIESKDTDKVKNLRDTLESNLIAPFALTEAFKPLLVKQPVQGAKEKRIVNITSGLGSVALMRDHTSPYTQLPVTEYRISKAALNMMAACHSFELRNEGVKSFAFCPGYVATEISGTLEERRKRGAHEPSVSAEHCLAVIEGRHDENEDKLMTVLGGVITTGW